MAETTSHGRQMTREEMAEFLRSIADELDSDGGPVRVPVGNKDVQLAPPETVNSKATVTERSRRLRRDTEELSLEFKWKRAKGVAKPADESETEPGQETEPGTDPEIGSEPKTGPGPETDR